MTRTAFKEVQPHIIFLDSIRGLAALSVVCSHYVLAYGLPCQSLLWEHLWTFTPLHIWWDGFAAVSLFFVLSGLVLSVKYFRTSTQPNLADFSLQGYLINRVCRIWLPYLVVLVVSAILRETVFRNFNVTKLPPSDWILSFWQESLTIKGVLKQGVLILPFAYQLIPQGWTLYIEVTLSFLLPIGIILVSRSTYWLLFFTLFAINFLNVSPFLFHFAMGLLIAQNYQQIQYKMEQKRSLRILSLIIGIFLYTSRYTLPVYLNHLMGWNFHETWIWTFTGLGAMALLVFVMGSRRTQTLLSHPWLRWVGKISYSIYLIHFAVLLCVTPITLQLFNNYSIFHLPIWIVGFLVTIGTTLILATISYKYIEVLSMSIGKRLTKTSLKKPDY